MNTIPISHVATPEFEQAIRAALPEALLPVGLGIRNHLASLDHPNEFGAPMMKGTSAFDLGMLLLFIEELDEYANTGCMEVLFVVTRLTCKNWIKRLREECMCNVEWVKSAHPTRGNLGKFVVHSWGIFNRDVYLPFKPYVKMVVNNWLEAKGLNGRQAS